MKQRSKYLAILGISLLSLAISGCKADIDDVLAQENDVSANDFAETSENTTEGFESTAQEETVKIPLEGLYFEKSQIVLDKGDEYSLSVTLEPENATVDKIKWSSLNPDIAYCDSTGRLIGVSGGTTLVMAQSETIIAACLVNVNVSLTGIAVSDMELELDENAVYPLEWEFVPADTTEKLQVTFSSDDEKIVTVDEEGNLRTINNGIANITVNAGEYSESCQVKVATHLKELAFGKEEYMIDEGAEKQLDVKLSPDNITEKPVLTYTSSDPSVISVDKNGKVKANKPGSAVISVSSGELSASCTVTVNVPVTGIAVDSDSISMVKGQSHVLGAVLLPQNTTEKPTISYGSSNPAVAAVDGEGNITALGAGSAVITANAAGYSSSCTVNVTSPLQSIGLSSSDITLWKGSSAVLSVGYNPADTTDSRAVTFTTSDANVAVVDNNGNVTAVGDGTCTVTAVSGNCKASCIVRVHTYVNVTGVNISASEITLTSVGQTSLIAASPVPSNATNPAVTFSSSNPGVATVNSAGLITAISGGTAVITAAAEGGVSATCNVFVDLPPANKVVVLDPGHGGADPGAGYYGLNEKDLTLKVALYCKAYLEENYSGVTVLLTRSTDTQLTKDETNTDLRTRCEVAVNAGADIMVSLHFNSSPAHNAQGALVLISKQPSVTLAAAALGNSILNQLAALGINNRGTVIEVSSTLSDENGPLDYYAINRICAMYGLPGIIVEHCFMDNASDVGFCDSEEDLYKLGVADAIGIASYLGLAGK